jgi:hypothetical protein
VAQTPDTCNKDPTCLAESRELHKREKHRADSQRTYRKRKKRQRITREKAELIRQLYAQGLNGHQIAAKLGIGHTAVYRHLGLNLYRKPRWTDDENQIMVDGYAEGRPVKEIAAQIGRSPRAVMVAMCRYRKKVREDKKKQYVLRMIGKALAALRKADILRGVEEL